MIASCISAIVFIALGALMHLAKGSVPSRTESREPWGAKHSTTVLAAFFAMWLLGLWTGLSK